MSKEQARTATGRLNNGVSLVPPAVGKSDLQQFTQTLPINQYRDLILETINNNQVCLVSGETGSGKTTQVGFVPSLSSNMILYFISVEINYCILMNVCLSVRRLISGHLINLSWNNVDTFCVTCLWHKGIVFFLALTMWP